MNETVKKKRGKTVHIGMGILVFLLALTLMLLYGIAGAYQPAVQASIPALVQQEEFMRANAVINVVSSFA